MTIDINPDLYAQVPDEHGRFGIYGGKFVAETLMSALAELASPVSYTHLTLPTNSRV